MSVKACEGCRYSVLAYTDDPTVPGVICQAGEMIPYGRQCLLRMPRVISKGTLSNLYYLKREIAADELRLAEVTKDLDGLKAQALTGMPKGGGDSDRMATRIARAEKLRAIIAEKKDNLQAERIRLEYFISTIPDSYHRQLLTARYIEGKSWNGVAVAMGGISTANSLRMAHIRWLEEMNRKNDC